MHKPDYQITYCAKTINQDLIEPFLVNPQHKKHPDLRLNGCLNNRSTQHCFKIIESHVFKSPNPTNDPNKVIMTVQKFMTILQRTKNPNSC